MCILSEVEFHVNDVIALPVTPVDRTFMRVTIFKYSAQLDVYVEPWSRLYLEICLDDTTTLEAIIENQLKESAEFWFVA